MFGIDKLKDDIQDVQESIDLLRSQLLEYSKDEVTFEDMKIYFSNMLTRFQDEFESKFKMNEICNHLNDILKQSKEISKKDYKDVRVVHDEKYCPACTENAIMPSLPKCKKKKEKI